MSRTEYMREYQRGRRAKDRTRHCNYCGDEYVPARSDSRWCSSSCKGYAYRARYTYTHEFSSDGWCYADNEYSGGLTHKECYHLIDGRMCDQTATVAITVRRHFRDFIALWLYCAEHAPSRDDYSTFR
jgi:hypothetical protein